ncbi:MAG: hypothetical protein CMN78_01355 [Spirochaetales bacterium]|nr:hypothetical protein [Spirochaetales bacterium]
MKNLDKIALVSVLLGAMSVGLFAQTVISVSVPGGHYSDDQQLELAVDGKGELFYSFAESRDPRFIPYLIPFSLSALPGEERDYTLRVEARTGEDIIKKKEFTYVIDKKPPNPPEVSVPNGSFIETVSVTFLAESRTSIIYCINGSIQDEGEKWSGEELTLRAGSDSASTYVLKAYAVDSAGNMSTLRVWTYVVGQSEIVIHDELKVLSPQEGFYSNRQFLVIRSAGYSWIRYSLSGEDPQIYGVDYHGPVLIDLAGQVALRIAGRLKSTGDIQTARIDFRVEEANVAYLPSDGGLIDKPLLVELNTRDTLFFSLDDSPARRRALLYEGPFKIDPVENGVKYLPLRLVSEGAIQSGAPEHRYFFIIDDRSPSGPEIVLDQVPPVRQNPTIEILGPDDADIFYTVDGTSPDPFSEKYNGPVLLELPTESEAGSIFIKAAAYGRNGRKSDISSALITFDTIPPEPPEITYLGRSNTAGITVGVKGDFGTDVLYEMTLDDSLPGVPDHSSLKSTGFLELDVPYGMERIFAFRFAAIDIAGNLSTPTAPFRVLVDKVPPDPPVLAFVENAVSLVGEGSLYYTLTDDGSEPSLPEASATQYVDPIPVEFEDGALNEVKIKAVSIDNSGNISRVSDTFAIIEDRRNPYLPTIGGVTNNEIYSSRQELRLENADVATRVYYAVTTDGSEPADPDSGDQFISDILQFEGVEGRQIQYRIKLRPALINGNIQGEVQELTFVIDRLMPPVPVPSGFMNGQSYNHGVFVLPPADGDNEIYFALISSPIPDPPPVDAVELLPFGENSRRFSSPLRLDVPEGEEGTFYFRVGAMDSAGNRSLNSITYSITVDRKPPDSPVVAGVPFGGVSRDEVSLSVVADYPTHYEISTDGTLPAIPTHGSIRYLNDIGFTGEQGREVLYTVRLISFDEVGNASPQTIERFSIDLKAPDAVLDPTVSVAGDSSVSVSWTPNPEERIYYYVATNATDGQETFVLYETPFTIPHEINANAVTLSYYARDKAGNTGSTSTVVLQLPVRAGSELFHGIEEGGIYNSRQTVRTEANGDQIHYEITTNGPPPTRVSTFSPVMPGILSFDAAPGETVTFTMRAAIFQTGESEPIQEQTAQFTIDKAPPPPPNIPGWEEEMYFQEDFDVEMEAEEGSIFVSINGRDYSKYTSPITLRSVSGGVDQYTISAYSRDVAGNKSLYSREWRAFIDRRVVYVSPNDNDLYTGSRNMPYRTIKAALQTAKESERKTVYLAQGVYRVRNPITLGDEVTIIGGFEGQSWENTGDSTTTILLATTDFPEGEDLILQRDGKAALQNLSLEYETEENNATYIRQNGGTIEISNITIALDVANKTIISVDTGAMTIKDSEISAGLSRAPSLVTVDRGILQISGSRVECDAALRDIDLVSLFDGSTAILSDTQFSPGRGRITSALRAVGSTIEIKDVLLGTGEGSINSIGLFVINSTVNASGMVINGNNDAWIASCVEAESSELSFTSSHLYARADRGAVAIRAEDTKMEIHRSRIRGLTGSEFIYLLQMSDSSGVISGSMLSGDFTRDLIALKLSDTSLSVINNTVVMGSGSNVTVGVTAVGRNSIDLINNIFYKDERSKLGTAIYIDDISYSPRILNNSFSGWELLLESSSAASGTIEELDALDEEEDGGTIANNISETYTETFRSSTEGIYRLAPDSRCVNAGFSPVLLNFPTFADFDGDILLGSVDIGADER